MNAKSTLPFPPPTPHTIAAGDVFSRKGNVVVVAELIAGSDKATCFDVTGKKKEVLRSKLEREYFKVSIKEATAFQKQIKPLLKEKPAKPKANAKAKTTPAPKRKASNRLASGPNPALN